MVTIQHETPNTAVGPKGFDFLKTILGFYSDPIRLFENLHHQYGDIVRMEGAGYCAHLITQPEHIKYVLQENNKNYQLSGIFEQTKPVVGKGLTNNNGASWLRQRRLVQSAFHRQHIAAFGQAIAGVTQAGVAQWQRHAADGKPFQLHDAAAKINHRIIAKVLFSVDLADDDPFLMAFHIVRRISVDRYRSMIPLPASKKYKDAIETVDAFTYQKIRERRENPDSGEMDILSLLLMAQDEDTGEMMTDTELHDELMTLFFAAYEDVTNAVSWALYLLSQNPEAERKLFAEITSVLGDRPAGAADLSALPYLTMVVNEVLRLYPPAWSLLRDAIGDDNIGGYHIPAGSMIIFDVYLTHRLPEYWEDPERFDPERFTPERSAGRPRFAYLPFGGGPRQCIGNELALMQTKLMLVQMLQRYQFTLISVPPIRMNADSSLRPDKGLWMSIQPREG